MASVARRKVNFYEDTVSQFLGLKTRLPDPAIERLALEVLFRVSNQPIEKASSTGLSSKLVDQFCHALIDDSHSVASEFVSDLLSNSISADDVFFNLFAEAARRLGNWWERDHATFAEVTVASARIYSLMRSLRQEVEPILSNPSGVATFASVPGETHTLGVTMAAQYFRKNGWEINLKIGKEHNELVESILAEKTDLLGLSISGEHSLPALARLVIAVRMVAPNTHMFVGGKGVDFCLEELSHLQLDAVVADVEEAVDFANSFVEWK